MAPAVTLPTEIVVEEILPRLPAKSLLRFKCVCKFFQTLISTPEFIHRHLRHSLSSDANRLLLLIGKSLGLCTFYLDSPEFPPVSICNPQISCINEGHGFIGSCNGLVCVRTNLSSFIIFNPSTGVYREIYLSGYSYANFGFGFDDVNDDYKIVGVEIYMGSEDEEEEEDEDEADYVAVGAGVMREVKVYSLKSDSWSLVEKTFAEDSTEYKESGVVIDNHLVHWKFWNRSTGKLRIGCFDLRSNQWGDDVPLLDSIPQTFKNVCFDDVKFPPVGVLDGCLCLLSENSLGKAVDVWVMKEYGVKDSWVKLVSIPNRHGYRSLKVFPFAYGKGSQSELLVRVDSYRFFWFNFRDKTWTSTEILMAPAYPVACMCKGSLVSIPGGVPFTIQASKNQGQRTMQASVSL